ncbi:MAG: PspC domain-containing protein [Paludibacteraceae bacterium]|nr:PspC domain-containing protein [Paludibacteraceae bacterium]
MNERKLTKSDNKMLSGVLAGIAEYMDVDPTIIRIAYTALAIFSAGFPGLLLYIIMAFIIPNKRY